MVSNDFFFRSEDIPSDEILMHLVEIEGDRAIINALRGRSPVVLRGSRGVGKSFLMRVAEAELQKEFSGGRILPVYVTFERASLIADPTPERFQAWMIAKLCSRLIRAVSMAGLEIPSGSSIAALRGSSVNSSLSSMEILEKHFEDSWRNGLPPGDSYNRMPGAGLLKDAVEDLCRVTGIRRINLFADEAAHVFIPDQQRQFFTLMRDLRSPYLAIKAAVYPGATAFGDSFQLTHDATDLSIDRYVLGSNYAESMREIVFKQDDAYRKIVMREGDAFDCLSYAATGNPRVLLKTLSRTDPFNRRNAAETIRRFYREEIWAEHSKLGDRYPGHRELIDWGRSFIQDDVLPKLLSMNTDKDHETASHVWIHRDAPEPVRHALRLLCYSGILQEGVSGVRGTRSELGTRYMVNLGCQFAVAGDPLSYGIKVRRSLSIKRFPEFGANHLVFQPIQDFRLDDIESGESGALRARLSAPAQELDLTNFQRKKLAELHIETIGQVLEADESEFKKAYYVGSTRARQMRNAAIAAVTEYLSG